MAKNKATVAKQRNRKPLIGGTGRVITKKIRKQQEEQRAKTMDEKHYFMSQWKKPENMGLTPEELAVKLDYKKPPEITDKEYKLCVRAWMKNMKRSMNLFLSGMMSNLKNPTGTKDRALYKELVAEMFPKPKAEAKAEGGVKLLPMPKPEWAIPEEVSSEVEESASTIAMTPDEELNAS